LATTGLNHHLQGVFNKYILIEKIHGKYNVKFKHKCVCYKTLKLTSASKQCLQLCGTFKWHLQLVHKTDENRYCVAINEHTI
jgi:hypothetical protein